MNLNCFETSFEMFQNKVRIIRSSTSFGDVSIKQCLKIFFLTSELKLVLWPNTYHPVNTMLTLVQLS